MRPMSNDDLEANRNEDQSSYSYRASLYKTLALFLGALGGGGIWYFALSNGFDSVSAGEPGGSMNPGDVSANTALQATSLGASVAQVNAKRAVQSTPLNTEMIFSGNTTDSQTDLNLFGLPGSDFGGTFASDHETGGGRIDIFTRHWNSTVNPVTGDLRLSENTAGDNRNPSVAVAQKSGEVRELHVYTCKGKDGDGDTVCGVLTNDTGGILVSEFQINVNTSGHQRDPVAVAVGENFFVAFEDDGEVKFVPLDWDASALTAPIQANTYTLSSQREPFLLAIPGKNQFGLFWTSSGQDGNLSAVIGRLFDVSTPSSPAALTSEVQINSHVPNVQANVVAALLNSGNIATGHISTEQEAIGDGTGAFKRLLNGTLTPQAPETQLNNEGAGAQDKVIMTAEQDGGATYLFQSKPTAGDYDLYLQATDDTLQRQGPQGRLNDFTTNSQQNPTRAALDNKHSANGWLSVNQPGDVDGGISLVFKVLPPRPVFVNPSLSIKEGETVTLTPAMFGLLNADPSDVISFEVENGWVQFTNNPGEENKIDNYTNQQLINGEVQVKSNGSEDPLTLSVSIVSTNIPLLGDGLRSVAVTYTNVNDAPVTKPDTHHIREQTNTNDDVANSISGNVLQNNDHGEGFKDQADSDPEGDTITVVNAGLIQGKYGVLDLETNGGYIYELDDGNSKVNKLTTGEVLNDEVFTYNATDGKAFSSQTLTITVEGNKDAPGIKSNIGVIGGGAAGAVIAAIGAGLLLWRKRQDGQTREQNQFADYLRGALGMYGVDDFDTQQGKDFVSIANNIYNQLTQKKGMTANGVDELKKLAKSVANAAKYEISSATAWHLWPPGRYSAITLKTLGEKANDIVETVANTAAHAQADRGNQVALNMDEYTPPGSSGTPPKSSPERGPVIGSRPLPPPPQVEPPPQQPSSGWVHGQ